MADQHPKGDELACIAAIRRQVKDIERRALRALRWQVVSAARWYTVISGSRLRSISLWRLEPIAAALGALSDRDSLARAISSLRFVSLQASERSDWSRSELQALRQELDIAGKLV